MFFLVVHPLNKMALKGSFIFVLNIIFGLCIDNLWTLNAVRPVRSIASRRIPIRPLDHSTMQRLSLRPTELNPDAEPIYLPNHLNQPRPLQIMERISVPVDWNHPSADKFNVMNFDAYALKPNYGYSSVNPVTERVYRMANQTDKRLHRGGYDTRTSPSQYKFHRSKNSSSKKQKKPLHSGNVGNGGSSGIGVGGGAGSGYGPTQIKEYDDLEFYRAYLEQQKQAAMMKRIKPQTEPSSRLPIGIDFFEQKKKNRMAYPPITYAPLYMNNLQRVHHHEEVEASNVQMQQVQMQHPNSHVQAQAQAQGQSHAHANNINQQLDEITSGVNEVATQPPAAAAQIPYIPTTIQPEYAIQNDAQSQTMPPSHDVDIQNEQEATYHGSLASEPEMYKFTIDDVVYKPQQSAVVAYPFTGPVTLPPPALTYQNAQNLHYVRTSINTNTNTNTNTNNNNNNNFQNNQNNLNTNNIIVNENNDNNANNIGNNNVPVSANTIHENRFDPPYQTQLNYPPNAYVQPRLIYRRPGQQLYKHIPFEGASSHQQIQKYSIDPVEITTQIAVAVTEKTVNINDTVIAAAIKPVYETVTDLKRTDKRNKKRRQNSDRHKNDARKLNHNSQPKDLYGLNLEFSNSYTKQRTQGYNSEEELATTPISPVKLKHFVKHDNNPNTENITTIGGGTAKSEKIKHFQ